MDGVSKDEEETPLEQIVGSAVMALTFLVGFGLLALDVSYFWIAFPVGFAGLLPFSIGLVRYYERTRESSSAQSDEQQDALDALRERYASGELTDQEFERKVEQLLETESVEDAQSYAKRIGAEDRETDRLAERE